MRSFGFLIIIGFLGLSAPAYSSGFAICAWQGEEAEVAKKRADIARTGTSPSSVLLQRLNASGREQPCGGVLIGARWVLTARHCVEGSVWKRFDVTHPKTESHDAETRAVLSGICPGEPAQFPRDDLAILMLEEPFSKAVPHASLQAKEQEAPFVANIARWPTRRLKEAPDLIVMPLNVVRKTQTPMLVAELQDKTAPVPCGGESGSTIYDPNSQDIIGVLSAISGSNGGRPNCNDPQTKLYVTPIGHWVDWINETIATCEVKPDACVREE